MDNIDQSGPTGRRAPFEIIAIDHVVFRVGNLTRSREFYCDILGCDVVRLRPDLNMVHLQAGACMIDLVEIEKDLSQDAATVRAPGNVDHLCLCINTFDENALVGYFTSRGVDVEAPAQLRYGNQGDGMSLYIRDFDGNRIELRAGTEKEARSKGAHAS